MLTEADKKENEHVIDTYEPDENDITKLIFNLSNFIITSKSEFLSLAEDGLSYSTEDKAKLTLIIRIFLLYDLQILEKCLREYKQIFLILSLYYYILVYRKVKAYDSGPDLLPKFPISGIQIGQNIESRISLAQEYLLKSLNYVDTYEIYNLNIYVINALNSSYIDIRNQIDSYMEKAKAVNDELKNREEKWKLSSFSGTFDKIAQQESEAKRDWLGLSIIFGSIALIILLYNIYSIFLGNFNFTIVECIMRISTPILLFIIAFWFSKTYSVARNQEITYRHIAAVLNVYDMFKDSARDVIEKNIIMTEMAHTIFSPPKLPNTKIIAKDDMPQVIELIKLLNDKKDG